MGMSVQKHFVTARQDHQNLPTSWKEAFSFLHVFMKVVQYILSKIVSRNRKNAISYKKISFLQFFIQNFARKFKCASLKAQMSIPVFLNFSNYRILWRVLLGHFENTYFSGKNILFCKFFCLQSRKMIFSTRIICQNRKISTHKMAKKENMRSDTILDLIFVHSHVLCEKTGRHK